MIISYKNNKNLLLGHGGHNTNLNSHHTVFLDGSLAWCVVVAPLDTFPGLTGSPFHVFSSNFESWSDFLGGFVGFGQENFLGIRCTLCEVLHICLHLMVNVDEGSNCSSFNFMNFSRNSASSFFEVISNATEEAQLLEGNINISVGHDFLDINVLGMEVIMIGVTVLLDVPHWVVMEVLEGDINVSVGHDVLDSNVLGVEVIILGVVVLLDAVHHWVVIVVVIKVLKTDVTDISAFVASVWGCGGVTHFDF